MWKTCCHPAESKPAYLIQELFHLGRPFLNSKTDAFTIYNWYLEMYTL